MNTSQKICWNCAAERTESRWCSPCGVLQECDASQNPFDVLGVSRSLCLSLPTLTQSFMELSRALHPDFFGQASAREQEHSLDHSAQVNDAYRDLKDMGRRVEVFLRLEGVELETGSPGAWTPPGEFLMDMLELNETIEGLSSQQGSDVAKGLFAEQREALAQLEGQFEELGQTLDGEDESGKRTVLLVELQEAFGKYQYVKRTVDRLRVFAR